jgi:hypothetical protein
MRTISRSPFRSDSSEVGSSTSKGAPQQHSIGAHGVNAWLEPRFTADIEITACIDPPAMLRLRRVFVDADYAPTVEPGGHLPSGPDFVRFPSADCLTILEIQSLQVALLAATSVECRTP